MEFNKTVSMNAEGIYIELQGFINENAAFGDYNLDEHAKLVIDCKNVELINSAGIVIWINWFKALSLKKPSMKFYFLDVPKILMDQFSKVKNFLPLNGEILSFIAPHYCGDCNIAKEIKVEVAEHADLVMPELKCEKCGQEMEPDFFPVRYKKLFGHEKLTAQSG